MSEPLRPENYDELATALNRLNTGLYRLFERLGPPVLRCAHCGQPRRGNGNVDGRDVCHTDEPDYPDCYRLITVYGEEIGSRRKPPEEKPETSR